MALSIKGALQVGRNLLGLDERLDAELLLCHALQKPRHYLYAWPEKHVETEAYTAYSEFLLRRHSGEPTAYILGTKEFYGISFAVTKDVLIPRPETELLIEIAHTLFAKETAISVADLGTGSGAIAIALASTRKKWQLHATDISHAALNIAKKNAKTQDVAIQFYQGHWCEALPRQQYDLIISNPPYIREDEWEAIKDSLKFEPASALLAEENGLLCYQQILKQIFTYLKPGGYFLFEHGASQAEDLVILLTAHGFTKIKTFKDLSGHARVILAQCAT